jgi:hypothetical protein
MNGVNAVSEGWWRWVQIRFSDDAARCTTRTPTPLNTQDHAPARQSNHYSSNALTLHYAAASNAIMQLELLLLFVHAAASILGSFAQCQGEWNWEIKIELAIWFTRSHWHGRALAAGRDRLAQIHGRVRFTRSLQVTRRDSNATKKSIEREAQLGGVETCQPPFKDMPLMNSHRLICAQLSRSSALFYTPLHTRLRCTGRDEFFF